MGEPFRWQRMWGKLAHALEMEVAEPQSLSMATHIPALEGAWQALVRSHQLQPTALASLADWGYGDALLNMPFDLVSDMGKIRRAGFTEAVSTEHALIAAIERLRIKRIIP